MALSLSMAVSGTIDVSCVGFPEAMAAKDARALPSFSEPNDVAVAATSEDALSSKPFVAPCSICVWALCCNPNS